jgi:hypothetical protein
MPTKAKTSEPEIVPPPTVELVRRPGIVTADDLMPVLDITRAVQRRNFMVEVTRKLMVAGVDYGVIPGTGSKPTLLKPGAERLCTLFGLSQRLQEKAVIEDWTGEAYGGEAFFYYRYLIRLIRNHITLGEGIGSCNSREIKFRYRQAERQCPECGNAAIIKGKEEYGGGWVCFHKKGGCGAKFKDGDEQIEAQTVGRVLNPDIADSVNNMQKMAHKRALVAAVLIATNASEFYSQDLEDMEILDVPVPPDRPPEARSAAPPPPPPEPPAQPWSNYKAMINAFAELHGRLAQVTPELHDEIYRAKLAEFGAKHSNEFKDYKTGAACYRSLRAEVERLEAEKKKAAEAPTVAKTEEEDF